MLIRFSISVRYFLLLLLCFATLPSFAAKSDTTGIRAAATRLNNALLARDTATIRSLLHKKISYGHSNGWIQNRKSVCADLWNGTLRYTAITEKTWSAVPTGGVVAVRAAADVAFELDGKPYTMTLQVLQVWKKKGRKAWVLLARQSGKM